MDARCSRCHRPLSNPIHVAAGLGPTCAAKLGLEFRKPGRAPRAARVGRKAKAEIVRNLQAVIAPMLPFLDAQPVEEA